MGKLGILLLLSTILITSGCKKDSDSYFPRGTFSNNPDHQAFVTDWYSSHLKALKEPSLYKLEFDDGPTAYRFVWLRTFHHPVAVRVVLKPEGSIVVSKVCDGAGGYEPGKLIINKSDRLSAEKQTVLTAMIESNRFWNLPTLNSDRSGLDGSRWIIEGVKAGKYHVVDRWSPDYGPIRNLGLFFLALGDIDEKEIY